MPTTQDPPKSNARRAAERICRGLQTGHKIEVPGLAEDIEKAIQQEMAGARVTLKTARTITGFWADQFEQRKAINQSKLTETLRSAHGQLTAAIAGMEGEAA